MSPSSRSRRSDNCRRNLSMQKSWNLWKNHLFKHTLKIKRYSQFVQVLHNCNFYDSPICHKDAEDGSGQGPHVRMQLYNCPLPSIQLSCIENYAAHTGPAPDPPSPCVSDVGLVVATPAMPRSRLPILRVCSLWEIRQWRSAKIFWQNNIYTREQHTKENQL